MCTPPSPPKKCLFAAITFLFLGSLSNDGGDVNKNGKKTIGLDWQNNNLSRAARFFQFLCRHCLALPRPEFCFKVSFGCPEVASECPDVSSISSSSLIYSDLFLFIILAKVFYRKH